MSNSDKVLSKENLEKAVQLPNEFAGFVKEVGLRAFNALSEKLAPKGIDLDAAPRLHRLAATWNALDDDEKAEFFAQIVAVGTVIGAVAPAIKKIAGATRKRSRTRKAISKVKAAAAPLKLSSSSKQSIISAVDDLKKLKKKAKAKTKKLKKDKKNKKDKKKAKKK